MSNPVPTHIEYVRRQHPDARSDRKFWGVAALSALTFVLLFQNWLSASGPNGDVHTDAFGSLDGFTGQFDSWGISSRDYLTISNTWGLLAGAASVVTFFAVLMYLRVRSVTLHHLVVGASAATALFVMAALLYLNSKAPELRSLVETRDDSTTGFGGILQMFFGGSNSRTTRHIASASLQTPALLCGLAAAGSAVVAIATILRDPLNIIRYAMRPPAAPRPIIHEVIEPEDSGLSYSYR